MPLSPFEIPSATASTVKIEGGAVTCEAAGYRAWAGYAIADQPIVALVIVQSGRTVSWARTSHRGSNSLEMRVTFGPNDVNGFDTHVSFGILDAVVACRTTLISQLIQPMPYVQQLRSGGLVTIADVQGTPRCQLNSLFLLRSDVHSVRNGVWHLRGRDSEAIDEPWHTMLTYGRTGAFELPD